MSLVDIIEFTLIVGTLTVGPIASIKCFAAGYSILRDPQTWERNKQLTKRIKNNQYNRSSSDYDPGLTTSGFTVNTRTKEVNVGYKLTDRALLGLTSRNF